MTSPVQLFICVGDLEAQWHQQIADAQRERYELAKDLEIERELGRHPSMNGSFEETEVEHIPTAWIELGPDGPGWAFSTHEGNSP